MARKQSVLKRPTAAKTRAASAKRSGIAAKAEKKRIATRKKNQIIDAKVEKLKVDQFISEKRLEAQLFDKGKRIKGTLRRKLPPADVKAADRVIKQLRKTTKARIKFLKKKK